MAAPAGIAFDAFGTLFDLEALRPRLGDEAFDAFSSRLVPYTWHLTAAGRFEPFPAVAKAALSDAGAEPEVADALEELPPFEDVAAGLSHLAATGTPLAVLSNGTSEGIEALVSHAGL